MISEQRNKTFRNIELFVFILFCTVSVFGMLHHEVWLDESNAWLLARDSTSLSDLIYHKRYEGHPIIWYLLLFYISAISKNILAFQLFHLFIVLISSLLFLRFSPFSIAKKTAILFSYYFIFEYNVICRNYAIGWLLLIILCICFEHKKRNYFILILILIVLANTHLFGLICTIPFFILILKELLKEKTSVHVLLFYCLFYLSGIAFSIWQIVPPTDSAFMSVSINTSMFTADRVSRFITFYMKSFFCLPDFTNYHFWNSYYIISHLKLIAYPLYIVSPFLPFLFFHKKTSYFIFYFSTIGIASVLYILPLETGAHYKGYCFMMFLVSLWLDKSLNFNSESILFMNYKYKMVIAKYTLWLILIIQVFSGVISLYKDSIYPFSEGKKVAKYLSDIPDVTTAEIIVLPMITGSSIASYFHQQFYYAEEKKFGTFCNWNAESINTNEDIVNQIKETLDKQSTKNVILILGYSIEKINYLENMFPQSIESKYKIINTKRFNKSIVEGENYSVYQLQHN